MVFGAVLGAYSQTYQAARLRWQQARAVTRACEVYTEQLHTFWPERGPVNRPEEYRSWLQGVVEDPRFRVLGDLVTECVDQDLAGAILEASRQLAAGLRQGQDEATASSSSYVAIRSGLESLGGQTCRFPKPISPPLWWVRLRRQTVGTVNVESASADDSEDLADSFHRTGLN